MAGFCDTYIHNSEGKTVPCPNPYIHIPMSPSCWNTCREHYLKANGDTPLERQVWDGLVKKYGLETPKRRKDQQ
jgi:hypothetical protein